MEDTYKHKGLRKQLVAELKRKGIKDNDVLQAIGNVPRHFFMDSGFINFSYKDQAFPIGAGQTISQPYTVAYQTALLKPSRNLKVLEIGTGSGYQAAVLLEMGAKVYTIERHKSLFLRAKALLTSMGYDAYFFYDDGYKGKPSYGPYDRILVTAGATEIPQTLLDQLKIGGRLVIPLGNSNLQKMTLIIKTKNDDYEKYEYDAFLFVPFTKGISNG